MSKDDLIDYDEDVTAAEFLASPRAEWIISKALYVAIKELETEVASGKIIPSIVREQIGDMKFLRHTVFPSHRPTESIAPWHGG